MLRRAATLFLTLSLLLPGSAMAVVLASGSGSVGNCCCCPAEKAPTNPAAPASRLLFSCRCAPAPAPEQEPGLPPLPRCSSASGSHLAALAVLPTGSALLTPHVEHARNLTSPTCLDRAPPPPAWLLFGAFLS